MVALKLIYFIWEWFNYGMTVRVVFEDKLNQRKYYYLTPCVFAALSLIFMNNDQIGYSTITYISIYLVSLFYLKGNIGIRLSKTIIVMIIFECLDSLISFVVEDRIPPAWLENGDIVIRLIEVAFEFLILSFLYLLTRLMKNTNKDKNIESRIFFIFTLCGGVIALAVTSLRYSQKYINESELGRFNMFLIPAAYLMVCFIFRVIMILLRLNRKNEELLAMADELREQQKSYYQMLLDKETETRKFRHDINNHISCIGYLLEQKDYQEVEKYVAKLDADITKIREKTFQTGDEMLDVILATKLGGLRDKAEITVTGKTGIPIPMDTMDTCTVFTNLLQNVQEAITGLPDAKVNLNIVQNTKKIEIVIENTVGKTVKLDKEGMPITTKANPEVHGIGCRNVVDTIEKYGGRITYSSANDRFRADVFIPVSV